MTIHLSKDQERFVHEAVLAGLYASEDELFADAVERLRQAVPQPARTLARKARGTKAAAQKPEKPLTVAQIHEQMMADGLITQLPDPALDVNDDDPEDQPVPIKGEPLSETIIRERR
jgi:Arc/MetJ-type ribon-helix-helix transcriptional regulator